MAARRALVRRAVSVAAGTVVATLLMLSGSAPALAATTIDLGEECSRISTKEKVVALTFDDAWIDADLESILAVLKEAGVRATFFPTGAGVASSPELTRRIVAEGHEIGSHAYTHSKLPGMTKAEMVAQIQMTEEAFSAAGVKDPAPLFRAPYGATDSRVLDMLKGEGYASMMWTARGGDQVANRSAAQVVVTIMADVRPGAIIVLHTRNETSPKALPELIRRIRAEGYSFVTLSEVLFTPEQRMPRYQQTSPLLTYLGRWSESSSPLETGGSLYYGSKGAGVVVSFTGTTLELIAATGPDCGKALVSIDGGAAREVDLYSATVQHRVSVMEAAGLPDTWHIALIWNSGTKNAASSGYFLGVDAFRVTGTLVQVPSLGLIFRGKTKLNLVEPGGPLPSFAAAGD